MGIAEKFKSNVFSDAGRAFSNEAQRAQQAHEQGKKVFIAQFDQGFGDAESSIGEIEDIGWVLQEFSTHPRYTSWSGYTVGDKTVLVCLFRRVSSSSAA